MKQLKIYSFILGGMLTGYSVSANVYDPGVVSAMPLQTQSFVNKLNQAGNQAAYLSSLPDSRRGMRNLETYYRNRHEYFIQVLNSNLDILEKAGDVVAKVARTGGPEGDSVADCVADDRDFRDFKEAFKKLPLLRQHAESGVGNDLQSYERPQFSGSLSSAYEKVAAGLDLSDPEGSFWDPVDRCCKKQGAARSKYDVCNLSYVQGKLDILSGIQKLPSNFVDPMNPGQFAPTLTPEDIVALMSLGQMQDFIEAKDYNAQGLALMNTDYKCQSSRDDAIAQLNKKGENRSLLQTGIQALQCSMGTLARNWKSKAGRQLALGLVKAQFPLFTIVSACPQQTQDAATALLTYTPEAYRNDFEHLTTLPAGIVRSQTVAKPVEIYDDAGTLMLELRDEAGYTRDSLFITDQLNEQYSQIQAAASQAQLQVVSTGTAGPTSTIRTTGRNIVNGVGTTLGNAERVQVRGLASKAAEGDLESARSLAGAVKGRKNELEKNLTRASQEKTLLATSKENRAAEARGLVNRATILEAATETTKTFSRKYEELKHAIGLTDGTEASGRTVERPGSDSNINSGSGTTVTSNLPAYNDRAASEAYKAEQAQKALAKMKSTIREMAVNVNSVAARLNEIIVQKQNLWDQLMQMADGRLYAQLSGPGFEDRGDQIMAKQTEIARVKKELISLNAQETGARAAVATAKMSFTSYVNGAAAFQGLDVRRGNTRAPASTDYPVYGSTQQQQQQSFFQMPQLNVPNTTNLSPTLIPPTFNPTPTNVQTGNASIFNGFNKWMNFFSVPLAQAATLSQAQKRARLSQEFDLFVKEYEAYSKRLEAEIVGVRQQAWERFIVNEREMRKSPLLSTEQRVIMRSFNDAVKEEIPALIEAKNTQMSASANPQIYKYIEQIRADSAELSDLLAREALINMEVRSRNLLLDDEAWTGILPAIALQ
ncbi:MAG: hypothetical protein R3A80_08430 [Bdellovibrionota bacterium]